MSKQWQVLEDRSKVFSKKPVGSLKLGKVLWAMSRPSSPAENRTVVLRRSGEDERQHCIGSIHVSSNPKTSCYLTVLFDGAQPFHRFVDAPTDILFPSPLPIEIGKSFSVSLSPIAAQIPDNTVLTLSVVGFTDDVS